MRSSITISLVYFILLSISGFIIYSNTFEAPFYFDDEGYIADNPLIKDFNYFLNPSMASSVNLRENISSTWKTRYFTYMTFYINRKFNDLDVTGYHVVNIAIHTINAFLLYLFILTTLKTSYLRESHLRKHRTAIALLSAFIFISHPLQTETVTYISQRFTSLATMIYLIALIMYAQSRLAENIKSRYLLYVISLLTTVIAMKTKEIAFTLPIVIAVYEFMFLKGSIKKRVLFLVPVLLTLTIIPLSIIDLKKPLFEAINEATRTQTVISRHDYLITQVRVLVTYIRLFVFPLNQNFDYDYPVFSTLTPQVLLSFLFLVGVLGIAIVVLIRYRNSRPEIRFIIFGVFWFFLTLSVESSVISLADIIYEHRLYLPSIGVFPAIVSGVILCSAEFRFHLSYRYLVSLLCLIALAFGIQTYTRNNVWSSHKSLYEDVASKSPKKPRIHYNLGNEYAFRGATKKAIEHYLKAIENKPDFIFAYNNLAKIYSASGSVDEAIEQYQMALKINPEIPEIHNNIGNAYFKKGLFDKAVEHYKHAIRLSPYFDDAHYNLGLAYSEKGLYGMARKELETTLRINPGNNNARNLIALIANATN